MGGGGLDIPRPGSAPDHTIVAFAAELIDRSGQAPVIETALAHRTGRPRPLPVRAVLAALLSLALDDRPLFLTDATRLLFCQLPEASRTTLGVTGTATTQQAFKAAYRRVRYCFHAITSAADPSVLPKNRRLTEDQLRARTKPVSPGQATAARDRLETLVNALLEASISVLSAGERAASGGGTALDATPVPLFSRGPSKRTGLSASDPDGGWYVREGDHREREDDKGKPLRKICWALEATIATTARPPRAEPACPNPAAPAPGSSHRPPPAATRPAGSATTAPTPRRSLSDFTSRPGRWATSRSWTTATTSSASRPTAKARCSSKAAGTAQRCPDRSLPPLPGCVTTSSPANSTTSRSPPARPTSSNAKTARTPTGTSGCHAPPSAATPG
jgi:hypothetical protein